MRRFATTCFFLLAAGPAFAGGFTVSSTSWHDGGRVPLRSVYDRESCAGGNRSPDLSWHGAPTATRSYAVTLFDPDAQDGSGWWHWQVFNLPPDTTHLPENAGSGAGLPGGAVQGRTGWGTAQYDGPCPPRGSGVHRYVLTVYALDVARLPQDSSRSSEALLPFLRQHDLAIATIISKYERE